MKLTFRLRFRTRYGQSLFIVGNHSALGHDRVEQALPLHYLNEEFWQLAVDVARDAQPIFKTNYRYILREADGLEVHDAGNQLTLDPSSFSQPDVLIIDSWNPIGAVENVFYTEPFKRVLLKPNQCESLLGSRSDAMHTF